MDKYIIFASLIITFLSLVAVGITYVHYRRMERKKDRDIILRIREQDKVMKELEQTRIERNTLEKLLKSELNRSVT